VAPSPRALTRQSTPTPKGVRSLRSHLFLVAGYFYVMPQAVAFAFSLLAALQSERRASCIRFVVAHTS
jgi:hypothetical protein